MTAAIAAVLIFALPPLLQTAEANRQQIIAQQAEEEARREARRQEEEQQRLAAEAAAKEQQRTRNVAIHKQKRAGLPYIGLSESSINSTQTLRSAGTSKTEQRHEHDWQGNVDTVVSVTYTWYTENRKAIFKAVCEDGYEDEDEAWDAWEND